MLRGYGKKWSLFFQFSGGKKKIAFLPFIIVKCQFFFFSLSSARTAAEGDSRRLCLHCIRFKWGVSASCVFQQNHQRPGCRHYEGVVGDNSEPVAHAGVNSRQAPRHLPPVLRSADTRQPTG